MNFKNTLSILQTQLNISLENFTNLSPNEIMYDFKVRESISIMNKPQFASKRIDNRLEFRSKTEDALSYANVKMKTFHDS